MQHGRGGNLGFVSKTTGGVLYLRYDPVGVNNWNVIISVEEKYALSKAESISTNLYRMAAVMGCVMLLYMIFVLYFMLRAYLQAKKMGAEDQTTKLQNRNAYEKFVTESQYRSFESLVCVYMDVNGLHEMNNRFGHNVGDQMLRTIADALKTQFQSKEIYRIGGDEFVVFCENSDLPECTERMDSVVALIEKHSYFISYGIICHEDEMGVDRITREADEQMLENKRLFYEKCGRKVR